MTIDKIADLLKFGINLKLSGPAENRYYAQRLKFFIMETDGFDAESEDDEHVDIYLMTEKVLTVRVKNSILTFEPLSEASYEGIMVTLEFVANMHETVQEDYKRSGDIEKEFVRPTILEESEEDTDDDFDWI
jgi:hypothetical protein|tara:strand:+ start:1426 stop:1821 length:396 start_codon:yes stop_codon:yes gene_type:complete